MNKTEYDDIKVNLIKKSLEKDKSDVYVPIERRKKQDDRLNFINLMCVFLWGIVVFILAVIAKAGKSISYITYNNLLWLDAGFWNIDLLKTALYITMGCILLCTFAIMLNFTRKKRRTDKIKKPLLFCEMVCFIILIFLILKLY